MLEKGLDVIEEESKLKSDMLYDCIDKSDGYYINSVDPAFRSRMNVPFRVRNDADLERKFVAETEELGMLDLKGHRSVGGIRATICISMPVEGVKALVDFMSKFKEENP